MPGRVLIVLMPLFFIGCAGGENGLSESEHSRLYELNQRQNENSEALRSAALVTAAVGNSQKLGKILRGHCDPEGRPIEPDFRRSNEQRHAVLGANCPITYHQGWRYSAEKRTLNIWQSFFVRNANGEYAKVNGIFERTVNGSITTLERPGGEIKINGTVNFPSFKTSQFGDLTVFILTEQTYQGSSGEGYVALELTSSKGWTNNAAIRWRLPSFAPVFEVDGVELDRKSFLELFSAYGMVEIMDNSLKMR